MSGSQGSHPRARSRLNPIVLPRYRRGCLSISRVYPQGPIPAAIVILSCWNCFDKLGVCCRTGPLFLLQRALAQASRAPAPLAALGTGSSARMDPPCPGPGAHPWPGTPIPLEQGVGTESSCQPFPTSAALAGSGAGRGVWESVRVWWLLPWESSREQLALGMGPAWGGGLGAS